MDKATRDHFAQGCTQIGILMEDASIEALTIGSMSDGELAAALERIGRAIAAMQRHYETARVLLAGQRG